MCNPTHKPLGFSFKAIFSLPLLSALKYTLCAKAYSLLVCWIEVYAPHLSDVLQSKLNRMGLSLRRMAHWEIAECYECGNFPCLARLHASGSVCILVKSVFFITAVDTSPLWHNINRSCATSSFKRKVTIIESYEEY